MHPDWTLRVPVVRPRGIARLDGAVMVAAAASACVALYWQSACLPLAIGAAAAIAAARALAGVWPRARVSAIRMDRDGAFYLRMRHGWQPAEWVASWRGPRWMTLRARIPASLCNEPSSSARHVTFTVWRDGLPAPAWRRACLLANRRLCRAPAIPRPAAAS